MLDARSTVARRHSSRRRVRHGHREVSPVTSPSLFRSPVRSPAQDRNKSLRRLLDPAQLVYDCSTSRLPNAEWRPAFLAPRGHNFCFLEAPRPTDRPPRAGSTQSRRPQSERVETCSGSRQNRVGLDTWMRCVVFITISNLGVESGLRQRVFAGEDTRNALRTALLSDGRKMGVT